MSVYQQTLDFVINLIQTTSPAVSSDLNNLIKWRPNGSKPEQLDTGYGFSIDRWQDSVLFLSNILSQIPIFDNEPNINPVLTEAELQNLHGIRIPFESADTDSLVNFLINNAGSYFLKQVSGNSYVVDFSDLEQYEVRPGFEKYGGKVFIKDNRITGFKYQGEHYAADDQRMDKIIRATLSIKMIAEIHALRIHLCTAQKKTFEFFDKYEENHPLADFLYLSTFGVMDVNRTIPVLIGSNGLLVRLFALTQESYLQFIQNILAKPALSRQEILGTKGTFWNKGISKYSQLVDTFISTLTEDKQEREDLANFFIASTAMHNQFGDAQIYAMTISKFFLPKVYLETPGFISKLDQDILISIMYSVTPRYPLIIEDRTAEVFSNPIHKDAWIKLQKSLVQIYEDRPIWFDPKSFEISVGF